VVILTRSANDPNVNRIRSLFDEYFEVTIYEISGSTTVYNVVSHLLNECDEWKHLILIRNTSIHTHICGKQWRRVISTLETTDWERYDLDGQPDSRAKCKDVPKLWNGQPILPCKVLGNQGHIFTRDGANNFIRRGNKKIYCTVPDSIMSLKSLTSDHDSPDSDDVTTIFTFIIILALIMIVIYGLFQFRK
jgi:hypothetical protein